MRSLAAQRGFVVTLVSNGLSFLVQGIYFVYLARVLGVVEFGQFTGSLALAMVLSTMSGLGAGSVMLMRTSRDPTMFRAQFGTALVYICVSAPVLASIGVAIAIGFSPDLLAILLPLFVSELVGGRLIDVCQQSFQAHDQLGRTALLTIGTASTRLFVAVLGGSLIALDALTWARLYAVCSMSVSVLATVFVLSSLGRPILRGAHLLTTWKTGVFFGLGMSSRILYTDGDKYILANSGPIEDGGVYSAASRIINFLYIPVQAIVYSKNSALFRRGELGYETLWTLVRKILKVVVGYSIVAAAALFILGQFVPSLLGPGYAETSSIVLWLAPILLFQSLHYCFGDALMASGRQAMRSICQAALGLIAVTLNISLVPDFGWRASATIALCSSALLAGIMATVFLLSLSRERGTKTLSPSRAR